MDVPDSKGRTSILKVHAKNKKLSDEVDLQSIAMRTPGFSGADLANLLNEVTFLAVPHDGQYCLTSFRPYDLPPTGPCLSDLLVF